MTITATQIDRFAAGWTAAEQSGDAAALDALLTDDFVGVGPLGFQLSKQQWLERHAPGALEYERFALEEVQSRIYGDTALVVARQVNEGAFQGNPTPAALRASIMLVSDGGVVRMAGIHMSFIAGTPGAPPLPGRG